MDAAEGDSSKLKTWYPRKRLLDAVNVLNYQLTRDLQNPRLVAALYAAQRDLPELEVALQAYNKSAAMFYQVGGWIRNARESVTAALQELDGQAEVGPEDD